MDGPNYTWKADAEEEALEKQMESLKMNCAAEQRRKQRELELKKSNIFYPFPSTSIPSTSKSQPSIPMPSTSSMSAPESPETPDKAFSSDEPLQHTSNLCNSTKNQVKLRYDIDEMKNIACKMQMKILLNKDKRTLPPGPVPFQRSLPVLPIRKNGLYRCVSGLEKPEPLNDVLNKLVPTPALRYRMIRKTSNIRSQIMEEEELENM